jgi:ATP phosphoribosyltransferase regulatory subunit
VSADTEETELRQRALLPAGLRDVLPPNAGHEADTVERLMGCFSARGYDRVKPPLVEFESSLFSGPGAAMRENTFRLMDPVSQRMMGLRADLTVQVARIAATRLTKRPRPLRICYAGQVLRVIAGQLNPERELVQVGAELVGADSVAADVEAMLLAVDALRQVGAERLSIDITAPRLVPHLLGEMELTGDQAQALRAAIDRKDLAAVQRIEASVGGVISALMTTTGEHRQAESALLAVDMPASSAPIVDRLLAVAKEISVREPDLTVTIDPVENRGFEYYSGIGFSLFSRGVRGELGRGGRYLVEAAGEETSTGFTLYMETVLRALPLPEGRALVYLPWPVEAGRARALREQGWRTLDALGREQDPRSEALRLGCDHIFDGEAVQPLDRDCEMGKTE